MKRIALLGLLGALVLPCQAFASDWGLDAHGGTLGFGAELNYTLNSYFTTRVDFNRYTYDYTGTKEQIAYDFQLHLKSEALYLDWHPFAGIFRVTAGYLNNKNEITAAAVPQASYTINGHTYTAAQVVTLNGDITFNSGAPYFGIGWSTVGSTSTGLGVSFDLGVLMQGSPKVQLTATGAATSSSQFKSDLAAEQGKVQNDVNNYKTYPVIAIGIVYRF
ncbi:MAG: hypothetical protein ACM3ZT_08480 [Bacillota bacterium]